MRAEVRGAWGPYQYKWAVFDGTAWIPMGTWTTNNYFDWTPTIPRTNYKVLVQVRGTWNTGAAEFSVAQPYGIQ